MSVWLRRDQVCSLPDGNDETVCLHLGGRDYIPTEPHAISVLDVGPAILELVILCLIHIGGR